MEQENKIKNKVVQTFADDMAGVIESSEGGLIKNIIHQEEASEIEKSNLSPESKKNRFFMLLGFLFILLTIGVVIFLFVSRKKIGTVDVQVQYTPIIFTDKTAFIEIADLNKTKIATDIWAEVFSAEVKPGGVEGIYLTENKQILGFSRFINLIKANIPQEKMVFFEDNFLIGATNQKTKDLFILLQARSFVDVFNEMRAWEARMFYDLYPFFRLMLDISTNELVTKDFEDGIIQNKNARILYDKSRNIVLMYVFLDDTSVLITNTENATSEVMLRTARGSIKK